MTIETKQTWDDTVLPFQLDACDIRGRVARLDTSLNQILAQHNYPPAIEALVAEAVILTALIGQTIKLKWKLSLQIRGDGPARLIATDYFAPGENGEPAKIRAFSSFDEDSISTGSEPFEMIGKGYFAVLIDQGEGTTPYSGLTPLAGGSLADCAGSYFAQSEQLPTRFALSYGRSSVPGKAEHWRAGGVMLQHLPKASPFVANADEVREDGLIAAEDLLTEAETENWSRANMLLETVEEFELIGPSVQPADLLYRLFHEESPRIYDAQPVRFGCTCSAQRVINSLSIYSDKDIAHMTKEDGSVTADCQFCGAHYELEPGKLGFEAAERENGQK
ncbi:MAG: Hsp33 family molecular chaperone HslO [Rhodobacteraceae bacterium]|nr:Hsp33 family molecular chaperone HslO [Paracoccaceae bacterium]